MNNIRPFRQPINDQFTEILEQPASDAGAPFFDPVLNYLQARFDKINSDIGTLTNKKFRLEDQIEEREAELATIRQLLINEYRARRPANPDTGELIRAPFGLAFEDQQ